MHISLDMLNLFREAAIAYSGHVPMLLLILLRDLQVGMQGEHGFVRGKSRAIQGSIELCFCFQNVWSLIKMCIHKQKHGCNQCWLKISKPALGTPHLISKSEKVLYPSHSGSHFEPTVRENYYSIIYMICRDFCRS